MICIFASPCKNNKIFRSLFKDIVIPSVNAYGVMQAASVGKSVDASTYFFLTNKVKHFLQNNLQIAYPASYYNYMKKF